MSKKGPTVDVIIPARNEAKTIVDIVGTFVQSPSVDTVFVSIDADTTDNTKDLILEAIDYDVRIITFPETRGKGQCVRRALEHIQSDHIIFCDGDYTGLTIDHVELLALAMPETMVIGIPDLPPGRLLPRVLRSWPWVSGFRIMPSLVAMKPNLHGYLMEVQLNKAAHDTHTPVGHVRMHGLISPFNLTNKRLVEMERDRLWGLANGVFK